MRAIAERFGGGVATAAEANRGTSGETEGIALRIDNFEVALDANGAVVSHRDFGGGHFVSYALREKGGLLSI
jgi:hypothetical protein